MSVRSIILWTIIISLCSCKRDSQKGNKSAFNLPYYKEASFTPYWLDKNDPVLDTFHKVSDFEFVNQLGDRVDQNTFDKKVYITNFFFTTCPGICPKMTSNFFDLQGEFSKNDHVLLLSHSVTPTRDSVPVLMAFAEENGVDPKKWHLVTGDQQEIYGMGRNDYFVEEDLGIDRDIDEFLHTENFVLIDQNRHIRGIYNGINQASVKKLIEDVERLTTYQNE